MRTRTLALLLLVGMASSLPFRSQAVTPTSSPAPAWTLHQPLTKHLGLINPQSCEYRLVFTSASGVDLVP